MNTASETMLDQVHPHLAACVRVVATQLAADGIVLHVISGYRTPAQQAALYAQGRTTPGDIVTNAPPLRGSHNFGLAVDIVPGIVGEPTWNPDWTVAHPAFQKMVAALKAQGLAWGGDWVHMKGDYDHFYIANTPANPTDQMRLDLAKGGLALVYQNAEAGMYDAGTE